MSALARNNSVIRAMFEEGKLLAAKYGSANVYDFSLGNPNFPPPESVKNAIIGVLSDTSAANIHGYMPNAGFPEVRAAVADALNARHGTEYASKNLVMSVGAAGGLNVALKTLLNPGDEVIAVAPYFVEYGNYVRNYDGSLVVVPARAGDFQADAAAIGAAVTARTKAVIINSPNNPTGVVYTESTIREIADVLRAKSEKSGSPVYIISDEPYRELAYGGVRVPWISKYYADTIVCYSWSKSLSLPGERIGYLAVSDECADSAQILEAAAIATRVLGFVNAPSLIQLAVARVLGEEPNLSGYAENRELLYGGLTKLGYECVYPEGAFYLWVKAPGGDDRAFAEAAKKYNILLVPGTSFAGPGYARLAYCVAKETIERALPAFAKLAEELRL
jgi:aspartate aminotransferase